MAKKTQPPTPAGALSPRKRAERVLSSQGRAAGYLNSLPTALQDELTSLCSPAGELAADVRARVKALFEKFYADQKATVEESPASPAE